MQLHLREIQPVHLQRRRVCVSLVCFTWYGVSHVYVWYRALVQEAHAVCHLCGTGGVGWYRGQRRCQCVTPPAEEITRI